MRTLNESTMSDDQQRKANRRLGFILFSVALVFGVGFVAKILLMGR